MIPTLGDQPVFDRYVFLMWHNGWYKNSKGLKMHLHSDLADFVNKHQLWVWHLTLIIFIHCWQ